MGRVSREVLSTRTPGKIDRRVEKVVWQKGWYRKKSVMPVDKFPKKKNKKTKKESVVYGLCKFECDQLPRLVQHDKKVLS